MPDKILTRTEIVDKLQERLDYLYQKGYKKEQILGIFLYGSQNYGFANSKSDIDVKAIIIPTFEELCLKREWLSEECKYIDNSIILIQDIRHYKDNLLKQNINFVETLFTDYYIINPTYNDLFKKYFIEPREKIATYNRQRTFYSVGGQIVHTLNQAENSNYDSKKIHNAKRLSVFLDRFLEGVEYSRCLHPKGNIHLDLWNLKYALIPKYRDIDELKKQVVVIRNHLTKLANEYKERLESPNEKEALSTLNTGVVEIIKFSLGLNQKKTNIIEETGLTKKLFFEELTNMEEKAYYSIIKEIHAEGNVTISKLCANEKISRSIYNNLLDKMKIHNVAEIVNMGMKGTYIKITHPELYAEAIDF